MAKIHMRHPRLATGAHASDADPYVTPTDEEWAAIEARYQEADRTFRAAQEEYFAHFKVWEEAIKHWQAELYEWIRLKALRTPVREYGLINSAASSTDGHR